MKIIEIFDSSQEVGPEVYHFFSITALSLYDCWFYLSEIKEYQRFSDLHGRFIFEEQKILNFPAQKVASICSKSLVFANLLVTLLQSCLLSAIWDSSPSYIWQLEENGISSVAQFLECCTLKVCCSLLKRYVSTDLMNFILWMSKVNFYLFCTWRQYQ